MDLDTNGTSFKSNSKFIPEFNFEIIGLPYTWFDISKLSQTTLTELVPIRLD